MNVWVPSKELKFKQLRYQTKKYIYNQKQMKSRGTDILKDRKMFKDMHLYPQTDGCFILQVHDTCYVRVHDSSFNFLIRRCHTKDAHAAMPSDRKENLKKYDPKHRYKNAQSQQSLEISCNLRLFQGHEKKLKFF